MIDFILPDIGEGIVECELLKWLVAEGDSVREDQPVAEVMTDKATVEIPAMHDGVVSKLYYKIGDIAKVHAPLFALEQTGGNQQKVSEHESTQISEKSVAKAALSTNLKNSQTSRIEAFVLPDIGEGIVECEIMQWHVSEGDVVQEDQVVVEVMTDKAVVEIPAKYNGKIIKLHYKKGDSAGVHTTLFDQAVEDMSDSGPTQSAEASKTRESLSTNPTQNDESLPVDAYKQGETFTPPVDLGRALASPAVRRLAREHNVLLNDVSATGAKGRVLKQDVLSAIAGNGQADKQASKSSNNASDNQAESPSSKQSASMLSDVNSHDKVESIKGIRLAMAKQMMASVSTIPHFSVSDELRLDNLMTLRTSLKPVFEAESVKLSFLPFFIKALSMAMTSFPIVNSRLNDQATELTYLHAHNIGIAVDSKIGLLVPNIKNVQSLSLFEIAKQVNAIIERAREGKLTNVDLSGGSISISNIGAIGGITASPVINKPEVAIVALGKIQTLPRFSDSGDVIAANMMMINWSGDHRVIDGATMVKFNNLWMDYLSHPEKMLVHLR